jgi:hypothetical protein
MSSLAAEAERLGIPVDPADWSEADVAVYAGAMLVLEGKETVTGRPETGYQQHTTTRADDGRMVTVTTSDARYTRLNTSATRTAVGRRRALRGVPRARGSLRSGRPSRRSSARSSASSGDPDSDEPEPARPARYVYACLSPSERGAGT